jgi:hypothetical protein
MSQALGIAVLAGVLSSGMFLAMLSGVPSLMLLAYFVQLPLLFAGLTMGFAASMIAIGAALLVSGLIAGLIAAAIYLVVQALPTLVVVRQALLARERDGQTEWYPPGLLLAQLAVIAALAIVLAFLAALSHPGGLQGMIEQFVTEAWRELEAAGAAPVPAPQLEGILFVLPSLMASSWLVMVVVNTVLAQAIAVRLGWNRRPTPALAGLELPWWLWPPIGLAAACAVLGGAGLGFLGSSVLVVLLAPYAFLGLAVIHKFADRWTHRGLALGAIYAGIVILGWPVLAVLALGLVEDWAQLRRYL